MPPPNAVMNSIKNFNPSYEIKPMGRSGKKSVIPALIVKRVR